MRSRPRSLLHALAPVGLLTTPLLLLALGCASPAPATGVADSSTAAADSGAQSSQDGQAADSQVTDSQVTDSQVTDTLVSSLDVVADAAAVDSASADAGTCVALATSGAPPEKTVAAPTFSNVLTHEGVGADPAVLKGKWTVMWFYPAATTAG